MGFIQVLLKNVMVVLSMPELRMVFIVVLMATAVAAVSRRMWVQCLVAIVLFVLSTIASIWVLQLGWALAMLGFLMILSGAVWHLLAKNPPITSEEGQVRRTHLSRGLMLVGIALIASPLANIFALMPMLRPYFPA